MDEMTVDMVRQWYKDQFKTFAPCSEEPGDGDLTDKEILALFEGQVILHEMMPGKLRCHEKTRAGDTAIYHIRRRDPLSRQLMVHDIVWCSATMQSESIIEVGDVDYHHATIELQNPEVDQIYMILWAIGQSNVIYAPGTVMQGLVVLNYSKQRFGIWKNPSYKE